MLLSNTSCSEAKLSKAMPYSLGCELSNTLCSVALPERSSIHSLGLDRPYQGLQLLTLRVPWRCRSEALRVSYLLTGALPRSPEGELTNKGYAFRSGASFVALPVSSFAIHSRRQRHDTNVSPRCGRDSHRGRCVVR